MDTLDALNDPGSIHVDELHNATMDLLLGDWAGDEEIRDLLELELCSHRHSSDAIALHNDHVNDCE